MLGGKIDTLARAYLDGLGAAAIVVFGPAAEPTWPVLFFGPAAKPTWPVLITASPDPMAVFQAADSIAIERLCVHSITWLSGSGYAERLLARVCGAWRREGLHVRGDWWAIEPEVAADRIARKIQRMRCNAVSNDCMMASIEAARAKMSAMFANGQMRDVNRQYREYRMAGRLSGSEVLIYRLWLEQRQAEMMRSLGEAARTSI